MSGRTPRDRRTTRRPGISALDDAIAVRLMLLVALSAAVMWALVRLLAGDVDEPLVLRLGVDGIPSQIDGAVAVWRVPFVATMLGLMSVGTALLLGGRDLFAARFVLGAGILVQGLIWVAAITLLG